MEDIISRIPILGSLLGAESDAEKALIRKQKQMAAETAARKQHQMLTAPNMTATAQSLLAFNPLNQRMAATHGAASAFSPEQFAGMVQNPNAFPDIDTWARGQGGIASPGGQQKGPHITEVIRDMRHGKGFQSGGLPGGVDSLVNYKGTDPRIRQQIDEYFRQKQQYDQAEERRRQMMMGGMQEPAPGPAPLGPRMAPAQARRF